MNVVVRGKDTRSLLYFSVLWPASNLRNLSTEFEASLWFAKWLSEAVDWWTAPLGSYRTKHWRETSSSVSFLTRMIPAEETSQRRLERPESLLSHLFWLTPSDGAGFELDSQQQPVMTMYFGYSQGFSCPAGQVNRASAQASHLSTKSKENLRLAQGKQNLRAAWPKGELQFKFFSSPHSSTKNYMDYHQTKSKRTIQQVHNLLATNCQKQKAREDRAYQPELDLVLNMSSRK